MQPLEQTIADLVNEHGQEAVQEALNKHIALNTTAGDPIPPDPTKPPK